MSKQYTQNFDKSRVGSVCMAACEVCGTETGEIILKSKSTSYAPEYDGPRLVRFKDARCDYCQFLSMWIPSVEGLEARIEAKEVKVGAAKIVNKADEKLVAYVPFTSEEPHTITTVAGQLEIEHGMVLEAEPDGEGFKILGARK